MCTQCLCKLTSNTVPRATCTAAPNRSAPALIVYGTYSICECHCGMISSFSQRRNKKKSIRSRTYQCIPIRIDFGEKPWICNMLTRMMALVLVPLALLCMTVYTIAQASNVSIYLFLLTTMITNVFSGTLTQLELQHTGIDRYYIMLTQTVFNIMRHDLLIAWIPR